MAMGSEAMDDVPLSGQPVHVPGIDLASVWIVPLPVSVTFSFVASARTSSIVYVVRGSSDTPPNVALFTAIVTPSATWSVPPASTVRLWSESSVSDAVERRLSVPPDFTVTLVPAQPDPFVNVTEPAETVRSPVDTSFTTVKVVDAGVLCT